MKEFQLQWENESTDREVCLDFGQKFEYWLGWLMHNHVCHGNVLATTILNLLKITKRGKILLIFLKRRTKNGENLFLSIWIKIIVWLRNEGKLSPKSYKLKPIITIMGSWFERKYFSYFLRRTKNIFNELVKRNKIYLPYFFLKWMIPWFFMISHHILICHD